MAMKIIHFFHLGLVSLSFFIASPLLHAQNDVAQTLSITTNLTAIVGDPVWLLELRDMESGQVLPYLFDVKNKDNFWVAYSKEHRYQVKASVLKFGPYATVNNFCYLENGVMTGKSMTIHITGKLSPGLRRARCHVTKFNQPAFITTTNPLPK